MRVRDQEHCARQFYFIFVVFFNNRPSGFIANLMTKILFKVVVMSHSFYYEITNNNEKNLFHKK